MKPTTAGIDVQSTLQGEQVAMSIDNDPAVMRHIIKSLTRLYSDTELAIIREYSTNGRDATIEAGRTDPIEVTTPTAFSPFFKVRDHGIGLTVDDIHNVYSKYGTSTKRASNAFNGMLGFGCKSALAYCDQFTVVSTKDGITVTVVVARDAEGGGTMTVLDTNSSGQRDGTEVQIPAKRDNTILGKAERFFSTWPSGSVLLNGKPPKRFEGLRITDNIHIIEDKQSYVVMGGVTYPATFNLPGAKTQRSYDHAAKKWVERSNVSIMAFVPIGAVEFTPSREALEDTDVTSATLKSVEAEFSTGIQGAIQREIDNCSTPYEAVGTVVKWNKYIAGGNIVSNYTYKGTPLPNSYTPPQPAADPTQPSGGPYRHPRARVQTAPHRNYGRTRSATHWSDSIPIHDWPTTVWVANYSPEKFTAQHKDKLRVWTDETQKFVDGEVVQFVLLREDAPDSKFIDKRRIVEWETIKAIKLKTIPSSSPYRPGRVAGSFDLWVKLPGHCIEFKHGVPGDQIDQKAPIFWKNANRYGCQSSASLLAEHIDKFTLVCLPGNRIDKFCREVPAAIRASAAIEDAYKTWTTSLTPAQREAMAMYAANAKDSLKAIDSRKVDDPALKIAAENACINLSKIHDAQRAFRHHVNVIDAATKNWKNPLDKYPLYAAHHLRTNAAHVYNYLNAVHAGTIV